MMNVGPQCATTVACDNAIILKLRLKPYISLHPFVSRIVSRVLWPPQISLSTTSQLLHNFQRHYMASSSRLQDDVDLSGRAPGPDDDELYGSNAPASGLEPTAEILDSQGREFGYIL